MARHSTSLVIKEMWTKNTRYRFISTNMANLKWQPVSTVGLPVGSGNSRALAADGKVL